MPCRFIRLLEEASIPFSLSYQYISRSSSTTRSALLHRTTGRPIRCCVVMKAVSKAERHSETHTGSRGATSVHLDFCLSSSSSSSECARLDRHADVCMQSHCSTEPTEREKKTNGLEINKSKRISIRRRRYHCHHHRCCCCCQVYTSTGTGTGWLRRED